MPQWLLDLLQRVPWLRSILNRFLINKFAGSTPSRPHRFSLWSAQPPGAPVPQGAAAYTAWPGLVNRAFTSRHLGPTPLPRPATSDTIPLFQRKGPMLKSERSSALFCFFAQWFTDSFLRTMPDLRRTDSNHEIDLCQIYGLDEATTWALREQSGGRLKSRLVDGWEHPPLLYLNGKIDPQFAGAQPGEGLSYLRDGRAPYWEAGLIERWEKQFIPVDPLTHAQRLETLEATGLERGNSTVFYTIFNTIFLREHNRLADLLAAEYKSWDNDQIFETARLINIRQLLTIVVDDYIRHLGSSFPFSLDYSFAEKERWYRTNRISVEFNLLYRWHSLVPDEVTLGGARTTWLEYRYNNSLIDKVGLEQLITDASREPAGKMCLHNTPGFMEAAEVGSLEFARKFDVAPLNDYRVRFGLTAYESMAELAEPAVAEELAKLYNNDVNAVEFTVGLLAEKRGSGVLSETLRQMVAYDAFTHILTNPVLAKEVNCEAAYSPLGWRIIHDKTTLAELVRRNTDKAKELHVSLAHDG